MEIRILDRGFNQIGIADDFNSLVWTERYHEAGDFEMVIKDTKENRAKFPQDGYLCNDDTDRIMMMENFSTEYRGEEGHWLVLSGRSIEAMMEIRPCFKRISQMTAGGGGKPGEIMKNIMRQAFFHEQIDPKDKIQFIAMHAEVPDTPTMVYTASRFENTYEALCNVSKLSGDGFKFLPPYSRLNPVTPWLIFYTYTGTNRSTSQGQNSRHKNDYVIFRKDLNTIVNSSSLKSTKNHYNVAIVVSGSRNPNSENLDDKDFIVVTHYPNLSGRDRKMLLVDGTTITTNSTDLINVGTSAYPNYQYRDNAYYDKLRALGEKELEKHAPVDVLEGELDYNNQYTFGKDYFLGDIVEMIDEARVRSYLRVTEYIYTQDSSGVSLYPTFTPHTYKYSYQLN